MLLIYSLDARLSDIDREGGREGGRGSKEMYLVGGMDDGRLKL